MATTVVLVVAIIDLPMVGKRKETVMYTKLKVMNSAAGYFLGRGYIEFGAEFVGSRESGYYKTEEDVIAAVRKGLMLRDCPENMVAWNMGDLDTCPGAFYKDENFMKGE